MDLKNIQYVYVAKNGQARQATTITDDSSATYIADGEIVVADMAGNVITTTGSTYTVNEMQIVMRKGTKLIKSPAINYKNVTRYIVNPFAAAVKQITYIGYNGTSGTLEAGLLVPATDYIVTIRRNTAIASDNSSYYHNKSAQWFNGILSSGQKEIADGLVEQLVSNYSDQHQVDNYVLFERVCSSASTAIGGGTTLKVTNGSKTIIASGAAHGLVIGDYVRIGGATVTLPVYKVTAVNSTTITVDVPFQGTTATGVAAQEINTPVGATAWGIKCSANDKTFEAGIWKYDLFAFDVMLTNFDNTILTKSVTAYKGVGMYGEVAEAEWNAYGAEGASMLAYNIPPRTRTLYADSSTTNGYDWIVILAFNNDYVNLHQRPESLFELLIAIPKTNTQGDAAGSSTVTPGVAKALDLWLTAKTGTTYNESAKLV